MSQAVAPRGLEGIVATTSGICWIDGEAGVLSYRGIDIHELAAKSTFEETTYLLWFGKLPTAPELEDFKQKLAATRTLPASVVTFLKTLPKEASVMEVLRTTVSLLSIGDPDDTDDQGYLEARMVHILPAPTQASSSSNL